VCTSSVGGSNGRGGEDQKRKEWQRSLVLNSSARSSIFNQKKRRGKDKGRRWELNDNRTILQFHNLSRSSSKGEKDWERGGREHLDSNLNLSIQAIH